MTHGTRAMLVHILYYQLPRLENIKIRLRTQFLLIAEAVGGLRVGEATGEVHGLRAINTCVLKKISTGKRSVELRVELIRHKEMQLHYEGLQRGSRVRRSRLLMMIAMG